MTSPSLWIERGPDGRPYYVRKRFKLPSTWQLLTEALLPRSARSLFSSRDSRQNNHVKNDPSEKPLALPAPTSSTPPPAPTTKPPPMAPTSQAQAVPVNMYLVPPQHNPDSPNAKDRDKNTGHSNRAPQPPQPFFAGLPPPLYPMPPHPLAPFPQPLPFQMPPQPFPDARPGAVPGTMALRNQVSGPPNLPPQRAVAPGDMRYKCEVCGRFRSTRYHYKHPIPPGQLPAKTVCQRCRDEATDSEDQSSSDSSQSARRRRRAHFDRPRSPSVQRHRRRASRNRPRSSRRPALLEDNHERYVEQYYSDSRSSSSFEERYEERERKDRRPRSMHEELVRHTRRLRLSPVERRRIYVDDDRRGGRRHQDEESESDVYEYETRKRVRTSSRARTPAPRAHRHEQYASHVAPAHANAYMAETYPYFQGTPGDNGGGYSPQQGPSLPHRTVSRPAQRQLHDYPGGHAEDHRQYRRLHSRDRGRHGEQSTHGRREKEVASAEHDQTHLRALRDQHTLQPRLHFDVPGPRDRYHREEHEQQLVRAPTPPPVRSSSMGHVARPDLDEVEHHETSSGRRGRRRSRSRTWEYEEADSSLLRPGDELTVFERHGSRPPSGDYDWYDHEGMRVRVREI